MDLRRLTHATTLADELHFARAAERAHLSQPAFSRSIQSLELELGVRLFDRDSGNVAVTTAGKFVIERIRRLLFEARCLQRDVDLYLDSQLGDTAFGVGPVVNVNLMPAVLAELRRRHPHVCIRVEQSSRQQLMRRLSEEALEFVVADVREPTDGLDVRLLPVQHIGLFVRTGHPLAGRQCAFAEAWRYGIATVSISEHTARVFAARLQLSPEVQPTPALQCEDPETLRLVTLATDTVLISTRGALRADLRSGAMVELDLADPLNLPTRFSIATLRNRTPSPMARTAMACIERVAAGLSSGGDVRA
ncbi:LysR family transcriptional regulator [Cupriavidus oxalaticus]|uniref:LysR family transcriptional regulator n=1 Tax=Cupriavidus oxalaticus TaxID=96344 RepID=UPI00317E03AC